MPAPDLQYYLDSSLEAGHVSGGAHAILYTQCSNEEIDAIIEAPDRFKTRTHWMNLMDKGYALEKYAQAKIAEMPKDQAAALRSSSGASITHNFADYFDYVSNRAFEDLVFGGFATDLHSKGFQGDKISRKALRRLHSSKWISRFCDMILRTEPELEGRIRIWELNGRNFGFDEAGLQAVNEMYQSYEEKKREAIRKFYEENPIAAARDNLTKFFISADDKSVAISRKALQRKTRRTTIRAAALASALLGSSVVSAFARGEPITIPAGEIDLKVSKSASVTSSGHGSLAVSIQDKFGVQLSKLCIYQDLPVLDQLASIAMYASTGNIDEVLEKGNFFGRTEAGYKSSITNPKGQSTSTEHLGIASQYFQDSGHKRDLIDAYTNKMRSVWFERMAITCFGRDYKAFLEAAKGLGNG